MNTPLFQRASLGNVGTTSQLREAQRAGEALQGEVTWKRPLPATP